MITKVGQRHENGHVRWVREHEVIDPRALDVETMADDATAKGFVLQHHYASSYPSARFRFGLYLGGLLHGVAVFSHPMQDEVLTNVFPGTARESVELGRLVLLDRVAFNAESWFVARCFAALRREGIVGVLSFSDPEPRSTADGRRVFVGHVGQVYQALNGAYLGRATPRTLRLLPDGTVFSDRARSKVRARERNWQSAAEILERAGASKLTETEDSRAWLDRWLPRLTRKMRHRGNHRYAWALDKAAKKQVAETARRVALPYPRFSLPEASR